VLSWAEEQRLRMIEQNITLLEDLVDESEHAHIFDDTIGHLFWLRDKFLTHRSVIETYQREMRRLARDHNVTIVADAILDEHNWEFIEREED
jgi:hypothetical protein